MRLKPIGMLLLGLVVGLLVGVGWSRARQPDVQREQPGSLHAGDDHVVVGVAHGLDEVA